MPKLPHARALQDAAEERKVRNLANSRHAPPDWIRLVPFVHGFLPAKTLFHERARQDSNLRPAD